MKAKKEYCGGCYGVKLCKAVHIKDLGGIEEWFCKKCRDGLATLHEIELL